MVHPKIALFWGAETNRVPYMAYTAASLTTSPNETQQCFQHWFLDWWILSLTMSMSTAPRATFSTSIRHGSVHVCKFFRRIGAYASCAVTVKLSWSQFVMKCWRLPKTIRRYCRTVNASSRVMSHRWLAWSWTIFLLLFLLLSIW